MWVTTGSVIRARDVSCGVDEKKTPARGRGFPFYVASHSQNLQGGKSRLYTGCARNLSFPYVQNWLTAG